MCRMDSYVLLICLGLTQQIYSQELQTTNPEKLYFQDNAGQDSLSQYSFLQQQYNYPNVAHYPVSELYSGQLPVNGQNDGRHSVNAQTPLHQPFVQPIGRPASQFAQSSTNDKRQETQPTLEKRGSEDWNKRKEILPITLDQTSRALTDFTLATMKNVIRNKQGNAIASPYSIANLLSLIQQGATGKTLEQIQAVLRMSPAESAAVYRNQTQDIKLRSSRNILQTANNMFVSDDFRLRPEFRNVAQRDFDSDVTPTNFNRPEQTARDINNWVASKTNNQITNLVNPDSLSQNSQMVLVNALYFKGLWEYPFNPDSTKPDPFHLKNGSEKVVDFMHKRRYFQAGTDSDTGAEIVVVPFAREEYSMMFLLPSKLVNADDYIRSLTVSQLEKYLNLKSIETVLIVPKFNIRADTDLTPVLKQMGINKIFEQDSGLSGLGSYGSSTPQVSSAVHSAVLSIDEAGAIASAASAFSVVALSNDEQYLVMTADRPFVAIVWDGKNNVPLFIAKIEDPTK